MKSLIAFSGAACLVGIVSGCDALTGIDNYDEPTSVLSGRVIHDGAPVQLRSRGVELELWQPGYELNEKIPIYVAQDGSFSAVLFDGDYRLNSIANNGPWLNSGDTLTISVRGETQVDVPVSPYFLVQDPQITHGASGAESGGTVTATFRIETVNPGSDLEWVGLYVGTTLFVDRTNRLVQVERQAAELPANWTSEPVTIAVNLPASVRTTPSPAEREHVFVRVGIKSEGVSEMIFSPLVKLPI